MDRNHLYENLGNLFSVTIEPSPRSTPTFKRQNVSKIEEKLKINNDIAKDNMKYFPLF